MMEKSLSLSSCFNNIPIFFRKIPWRGEGLPTPISGLENSMGCRAHGVAESRTLLSDFHFHIFYSKFLRFVLIHMSL